MRYLFSLVFGLVFALGLNVPSAWAKVRYFYGEARHLEAVITRVSISDAAGDADYNFNLRPLEPGEPSAFTGPTLAGWNVNTDLIGTFWWLWENDPEAMNAWRAMMSDAIGQTRRHFSDQCKQCAGEGPTGTACDLSTVQRVRGMPEHPCPRLFQCSACLYDIRQHSEDYSIADVSPNAEIFIQDRRSGDCTWNDLNGRLRGVMDALGAREECAEFSSEGGRWTRNNDPDSVCGQHVLLSGVRGLDQSHSYRPEIHPVTSMVIAARHGIANAHTYTAATFVDGSYDSDVGTLTPFVSDWTASYVDLFRDGYVSPNVDIQMSLLQGPRPPSSRDRNGIQSWASDCDYADTTRHQNIDRVNVVNKTASGAAVGGGHDVPVCPTITVDMSTQKCGAAWSANLGAGWRDSRVNLNASSRLDRPAGVIADASEPPVHAPLRDECYRFGPDRPNQTLKRWYRWEIEGRATYSNEDRNRVGWLWNRDSNLVQFRPEPPRTPPNGQFKFWAWLPTPRQQETADKRYGTTLESVLTMQQERALKREYPLRAPSPTLRIVPGKLNATVGANNRATYSATLTATPAGLCGPSRDYGYSWSVNDAPSGSSARELRVTLAQGERKTVSAIGWDKWAVESASDSRVFETPKLEASLTAACVGQASANAVAFDAPGARGSQTSACRSATLTATASETTAVGFREQDSLDLRTRYDWPAADFTYQAPSTGGRWRPVPANWKVLSRPKPANPTDSAREVFTLTLPNESVRIQATIIATDRFARRSVANISWSNEVLSAGSVEAQLSRLWPLLGRPGPVPAPCEDPRVNCPGAPDPLSRRTAWLRSLVTRTDPRDPRQMAMLARVLDGYKERAFTQIAAQRGITYSPRESPAFTMRAIRPSSATTLQTDARLKLKRQLAVTRFTPPQPVPIQAPVPVPVIPH